MNQYMIAFPSYYKAAFAQERLQRMRIGSDLGRTPPNLLKTCGYSIFLTTSDIRYIMQVLAGSSISYKAVYEIRNINGQSNYLPIVVR